MKSKIWIVRIAILCSIFCVVGFLATLLIEEYSASRIIAEQREFLKTAKTGIVKDREEVGKVNGVFCTLITLKDGTKLYLPQNVKIPTIFIWAGEMKAYRGRNGFFYENSCVAYEVDAKTNLVIRISKIPLEWAITKGTAQVYRIEEGGMLNNVEQKIIQTTEHRHLICPKRMVEKAKLKQDAVFYFEAIPETNQVKLIKTVVRK